MGSVYFEFANQSGTALYILVSDFLRHLESK